MGSKRLYFTFDLDTKKISQNLDAQNNTTDSAYNIAYSDVRKYLKKHGIFHEQDSAYTSEKPMSTEAATKIIAGLTEEYPYLKGTIKKFDMTTIPKRYDLTEIANGSVDMDKEILSDIEKEEPTKKIEQNKSDTKSNVRNLFD